MRGYAAVVAYGREEGAWRSYGKYKFGEFKFGSGIKFGQFKSPTNFYAVLPVVDVGMEERKNIQTRKSVAGYDDPVVESMSTGGTLTAEFTYQGMELLLLCVFGHEDRHSLQEDSIYRGFYNHFLEFEPDIRTRPWKFGEFKFGDIKFGEQKTRRFFIYVDCEGYRFVYLSNLIRSFSISGKAGETLKVNLSVEGWRREELSADISSVPKYLNRARFPDISLKIGDREISISSFNLSIERSFSRRKTSKLELDEPRAADWNIFLMFSSREKLPEEETYGVIEIDSGEGYRYSFYLPRLVPQPVNPSISSGRFNYEYSFSAIKPDVYPSSFPVPPSGERREVYAVVRTQEARSFWEV